MEFLSDVFVNPLGGCTVTSCLACVHGRDTVIQSHCRSQRGCHTPLHLLCCFIIPAPFRVAVSMSPAGPRPEVLAAPSAHPVGFTFQMSPERAVTHILDSHPVLLAPWPPHCPVLGLEPSTTLKSFPCGKVSCMHQPGGAATPGLQPNSGLGVAMRCFVQTWSRAAVSCVR